FGTARLINWENDVGPPRPDVLVAPIASVTVCRVDTGHDPRVIVCAPLIEYDPPTLRPLMNPDHDFPDACVAPCVFFSRNVTVEPLSRMISVPLVPVERV